MNERQENKRLYTQIIYNYVNMVQNGSRNRHMIIAAVCNTFHIRLYSFSQVFNHSCIENINTTHKHTHIYA